MYRDDLGAFATPTSDSTRTMLNLKTRQLLILINAYDGDVENLDATIDFTIDLLKRLLRVSITRYLNIDELNKMYYGFSTE